MAMSESRQKARSGSQQETEVSGVRSAAAFRGHPIHPMLIPLPIGALVGALVTDLTFWATADPFWAEASWWLLWAGGLTGLLAALVGLVDFFAIERVRRHQAGRLHLAANTVVLLLTAGNIVLRFDGIETAVLPWGLVATVLTASFLGAGGWYGGELAYRHGVGVSGH